MGELTRRSPFESLQEAITAAAWPAAPIEPLPFLAQVGIRAGPAARPRLEAALGTELPAPNRVTAARAGDLLWLGPDEWLLVGPDGAEPAMEAALRPAIGSDGGIVTLSDARTGLLVSGPRAPEVLSTCCALDLDPAVFGPGQCAQTLLAKAPIIVQGMSPPPGYRLLVRPSLIPYVVGWLIEGITSVREG